MSERPRRRRRQLPAPLATATGYRPVARALGVAESTIRAWANQGAPIPMTDPTDLAAVRDWLAARRGQPATHHWQVCRSCGCRGRSFKSVRSRTSDSIITTYRCPACGPTCCWKVVFRPKVYVDRTG